MGSAIICPRRLTPARIFIFNDMDKNQRSKLFDYYIEKFKEYGYDVYSKEGSLKDGFYYAYVTDGTRIIYFQIDPLFGFQWFTVCKPTKETGYGRKIELEFDGRESVEQTMNISYGEKFRNFNSFKKYEEKFGVFIKL